MTSTSSSSALSPATAHCLGYYSSPTGPSSLFEDLRSLPAIHTSLPQTHQARQKTGARFPGRSIIWSPSSLLIYPLRSSIKNPTNFPDAHPSSFLTVYLANGQRSDKQSWTDPIFLNGLHLSVGDMVEMQTPRIIPQHLLSQCRSTLRISSTQQSSA